MKDWTRLEAVIKRTGMSANAFALHIGLHRSENLYQIKKGNHGISKDLADRICEAYPEIDKAWLLIGEGSMLRNNERPDTDSEKAARLWKATEFIKADGREVYSAGEVVLLFHSFLSL